jgi:hypothetical protein
VPLIASLRATGATRRISSILFATAALLAAQGAYATKLIARYTFNESSGPVRNDSVGTNTAATEVGETGLLYDTSPIPAGDYGQLTVGDTQLGATGGLSNGDGSWVTGGNNEFGALTNDFTVMAWVKVDSINVRQRIIGRIATGTGGWSFGINGGGTLLFTQLGDVDLETTDPVLASGVWAHVAVSKSGSTGVTFFVNGVAIENLPAATGNLVPSPDPWNLLAFNVFAMDPAERLAGLVDDIRVYQGALDARGIREALETPGSLLANYTFGEAKGPTRFDWAGAPANANESGIASGVAYGAAPIPAGTYGSLDIAGNTFGANGGQSQTNGEWLTQGNNKLGTLTNDFTVMAWVKPDSVFFRQRVIGAVGPPSDGWGFGIDQGGLSGTAFIFTGYGVIDAVSSDTPIQANTWQHLAATKSSTAGVSFYLNGDLLQRDGGLTADWLPSARAWSLLGSTEPMAAKVDEVRVYQGVLDTQSIRDAASGFSCRNPNLALGPTRFDNLVLTDQDLIEDLNVTVDLSYGRVGDMNVILKHVETGTTASVIITPLGPGGIGTCNGRDLLVTLDDSAATFVGNNCVATAVPSIKGTFKPSQPLSKFFHESLAGTWRLQIDDAEGPGTGNLFRWCLQAQKASVPNRLFSNSFE